ncbi:MAG: heterodisulfide reductase-related iron-sulfur binding cluster [Firmicutes bacterium]|jgi:glycerol-3-phosphate dehydrogenase subunit C|uniref:4Fe-4S ferredoxin-type domain-containing protein n=1 Tax=Sulfobacillus benefaciens TaxID=453960 RepID=A0A2T2X499_9FIRM|nr:heterodisulfide reductase-related iron-sulfur binding cluster [Bacillota bacterium]MCL5013963.1 heterodisulfide reductase-related iron-sulfur binding cluster [Bacillota bacterium]PSR29325.1 MAG: hypothetical protein C7B43_08240 [Sulfobacillus benefaciens]
MRDFDFEDACVNCSACVSVCPVYARDFRFPGPKVLGPEWWRDSQDSRTEGQTSEFVDDCTFCQLCEDACPVGVPVAHLIAEHKRRQAKPARYRWRDYLLAHPHWIARFPQITRVPRKWTKVLGLSTRTPWPSPNRPAKVTHDLLVREKSMRVGVYGDCYTEAFDGPVLDAVIALLEAWGYESIVMPGAGSCCGAAAYAAGNAELGRRIASATAERLRRANGDTVDLMLTLNATCDSTLREEWPRFWHLSASCEVVPFTEFALEYAPLEFWHLLQRLSSDKPDLPYYVHTTCRSRVSRGTGWMEQIGQRARWTVKPLMLACCGAAGSYAFKAEHEELAREMGQLALDEGRVMTDSGTCALHLQGMTGLKASHPAYWLYKAYREAQEHVKVV